MISAYLDSTLVYEMYNLSSIVCHSYLSFTILGKRGILSKTSQYKRFYAKK